MWKKMCAMCLSFCLVFGMMAVPANAVSVDTKLDTEIELRGLYFRSASADLGISSSGVATAKGTIVGYPGITTRTTVHLYLQRYTGGSWVNVDDWLKTDYTVNCSLTKTKQVTKGYKYRVKASCYAYDGSKNENIVKYSATVTY